MTDTDLCLKPINDLLNEKFFIPAYQRGYRWAPQQVTDLLEDLAYFLDESASKGKEAFYCLQPIVVRKRTDSEWEVVDGQQRLTTVLIILKSLQDVMSIVSKKPYCLRYETRPNSEEFLNNIDDSRADENIDYHHIVNADRAIRTWFSNRDGNYKLTLLQCLLNSDDNGKNVKVIWYELPSHEDPVDVFVRLNVGKISLNNAELIRALFLRSRNFNTTNESVKQLIAQEWDGIEKALQTDEFWYFIQKGDKEYSTRIEYLFNLITHISNQHKFQNLTYAAFNDFYKRFSDQRSFNIENEWQKVKQCFMTLYEWYSDRILYHLVGFLITADVSVNSLMDLARNSSSKGVFRQSLRKLAYKRLFGDEWDLSQGIDELRHNIHSYLGELSYSDDRDEIRYILLLFNIATLLRNKASNLRFAFDRFKTENWDLEHIRSVKSDMPRRVDAQKAWMSNILRYWTENHSQAGEVGDSNYTGLQIDINMLLAAKTFDSDRFEKLFYTVLENFGEDKEYETDNGLANLVLLDAHTNRSYKNAVFRVKRRRIIALDKEGTFVPLCTTNAFLKYYSPEVGHLLTWAEADQNAYFNEIVEALVNLFSANEGGAV